MTAADHTPSPATDGLREAIEALADRLEAPATKMQIISADPAPSIRQVIGAKLRAVLAAHPAPPSETAPVLDGPSFGDYWPPSEGATEDESVRRYLDRVESVTTSESVLSVIREIRDELRASSDAGERGSPPDGGCPCCGNWPDECVGPPSSSVEETQP